jgi:hypothetical protein
MTKELTFTIVEREVRGQEPAKLLVDSEGFICGIFSFLDEAEKAKEKIILNIAKGKVNLKYATLRYCRPAQHVLFANARNQRGGQQQRRK